MKMVGLTGFALRQSVVAQPMDSDGLENMVMLPPLLAFTQNLL